MFPAHQQQQVRSQLAFSLLAVRLRQLVPRIDGMGRVVACEVMIVTPVIRNLIRDARTHQVYSLRQAGAKFGMQTMDQSLVHLVGDGAITMDLALEWSHNESDLTRMVSDASVFSHQFAKMMNSDLSLLRTLTVLNKQTENDALAGVVRAVANDIERGQMLLVELARHPKVFDHLYIAMVRAGETGGALDQVADGIVTWNGW